jgi:haloalkane dehalogenase
MPDRFDAVVASNTVLPNCQPPPLGVAPWPGDMIRDWVAMTASAEDLPVAEIIEGVCSSPLPSAVKAAYDAPFPDVEHKAAVLQFPALIPLQESFPGCAENRIVWEQLERWEKPFVTAFSDGDPTTRDWAAVFQRRVPGAANCAHPVIAGAGHFVQEEQGPALAAVILNLLRA